jgi:hypothetical protein
MNPPVLQALNGVMEQNQTVEDFNQVGWSMCACAGGYVRVSVCVCVVWLLHLCHATLLSRTSASYRTQLCVAATCSLAMQQASSG